MDFSTAIKKFNEKEKEVKYLEWLYKKAKNEYIELSCICSEMIDDEYSLDTEILIESKSSNV